MLDDQRPWPNLACQPQRSRAEAWDKIRRFLGRARDEIKSCWTRPAEIPQRLDGLALKPTGKSDVASVARNDHQGAFGQSLNGLVDEVRRIFGSAPIQYLCHRLCTLLEYPLKRSAPRPTWALSEQFVRPLYVEQSRYSNRFGSFPCTRVLGKSSLDPILSAIKTACCLRF